MSETGHHVVLTKRPSHPRKSRPKAAVEAEEALVEKPAKDKFDPRKFLAKVGTGKTILEFHKTQHVFKQGDVADTVFYIQKGKVKLTVMSEQGK